MCMREQCWGKLYCRATGDLKQVNYSQTSLFIYSIYLFTMNIVIDNTQQNVELEFELE